MCWQGPFAWASGRAGKRHRALTLPDWGRRRAERARRAGARSLDGDDRRGFCAICSIRRRVPLRQRLSGRVAAADVERQRGDGAPAEGSDRCGCAHRCAGYLRSRQSRLGPVGWRRMERGAPARSVHRGAWRGRSRRLATARWLSRAERRGFRRESQDCRRRYRVVASLVRQTRPGRMHAGDRAGGCRGDRASTR